MIWSTLLFKFEQDFISFQEHTTEVVLQSGLLLDEHDYQIKAHYETDLMREQLECYKSIHGNKILNFLHHIVTIVVFKNICKYFERCYKTLFDNLILCCRNQSTLNISIKRHFERRITRIKILDIKSTLKESTLLQYEVDFLNDFSLQLTQTNKSMMAAKEAVLNDKMQMLGFELFETQYSKGFDLDECWEIFKLNVDTFVYNTSEFLTALVLSFHQPFQFDDASTFYNLDVILPNFLKSFKNTLQNSEKSFENTKYFLKIKNDTNSTALCNKHANFVTKDLINHNICEALRHLQLSFEIVTKIHRNYNKSEDICDKDVNSVQICLKEALENFSYLEKSIYTKPITINENSEPSHCDTLTKKNNKIVVNNFEEDPVDEVFSCYISGNNEVAISKQYDDLFQNYTSQKMLISELQEKLDLLINLKGRKIAPAPGDQLIPTKEESITILENNSEDSEVSKKSLPVPVPPKFPIFDTLPDSNPINYGMTKSLAAQVQEIANRNRRTEEIFGLEYNSSDSDC